MSGYDVISQIFEFTIYKKDLDESISNKEKIIDIVNEKIDNIRCFDFIEYDDCYKLKNTFGVSDIEVFIFYFMNVSYLIVFYWRNSLND